MSGITAQWSKVIDSELLQRSSQVAAAIDGQVYVFGGELRPREPRDNDIHLVALDTQTSASVASHSPSPSPSPRVGSASTTLNGRLYLFSGRGGVAMAPVEEKGSIWEFDPSSSTWIMISPASSGSGSLYPPARSYHCMANNGKDTIYLHAGCPEKGRLSDLWSFNVTTKQWKELASAPAPARGGPSIAFAEGLLYRMNGFDGNTEQGGSVDIYKPETDTWTSHAFKPDGKEGPEARSVGALLPVCLIDGKGKRQFLVTLFGERDPSSLGHQGAGKMLGDVWAFDVENRVWMEVRQEGGDGDGDALPAPRGWFAADVCDEKRIVVQGGLDEANVRLGDVWVLSFA